MLFYMIEILYMRLMNLYINPAKRNVSLLQNEM